MAIVTSVEQIVFELTAVNEPVTTNLSKGQDETMCVPFWSVQQLGAPGDDNHAARCHHIEMIDNSGTPAVRVTATERTDSGNSMEMSIFVVEFASPITVQQVSVDDFDSGSTVVTINDVGSQESAFMIYSNEFTNEPASGDDWNDAAVQYGFQGSQTTQVLMQRRQTGGSCSPGTLYVVQGTDEFDVQHININVTTSSSRSESGAITAVSLASSFIIHTYETSEGQDDLRDGSWIADLWSTTSVRIQRTAGGNPNATSTHDIQVVQSKATEWEVQHVDTIMGSSRTTYGNINSVTTTQTVLFPTCHTSQTFSVGRGDSTTGGNIWGGRQMHDWESATSFRVRKGNTALSADANHVQVVEFGLLEDLPETITRELSDSLTLTDDISRDFWGDRQQQDDLTLTDTLARPSWFGRNMTEADPSFSDSLGRSAWMGRNLLESLTLTDTVDRSGVFDRLLSDPFTLTDDIDSTVVSDAGQTLTRNLSDSFTFTENLTRDFWGDRLLSESLTLTDTVDRSLWAGRDLADSATLTENLDRSASMGRDLDDSQTLTENLKRPSVFDRGPSDDISGLTDTLDRSGEFTRGPSDSLTLTDTLVRPSIFDRILSDVQTFTDRLISSRVANVRLSDTFTFTETLVREFFGDRLLSDSPNLTETLDRSGVFTRGPDDDLVLTDKIQVFINGELVRAIGRHWRWHLWWNIRRQKPHMPIDDLWG